MIDPKTIPDKVVEAAGRAYEASCRKLSPTEIPMSAAIAAALNAWPGAVDHPEDAASPRCLWLPLHTEARDVK